MNKDQGNRLEADALKKSGNRKIKGETIELLSPAGDFDALKAAVGNGADSVYFGSNYFNARKKAENIPEARMEEAIDYIHLRSCRAYLALNTLLLDDEIKLAVDLARTAYGYGIDAVIVQDLGFAKILRNEMPDLPLHASTQATIYDEAAIDACARIGFSRIILPRELSMAEIARLTRYAGTKGIETEVFVHGALCVCYSGQCIMSSMIGGRSGNRGECAQPCRLPYDITVSKRPKNLTAPHMATKDISAVSHIEELMDAGVTAFKIEGRMRSAEYVGEVTNEFRKEIRYIQNKKRFDRFEPSIQGLEKGNVENLLLAFNRGGSFSDHYLTGKKSPDMIAGAHTGSFGVLLGEIAAKNSQTGIVDIRKTLDVTAVLFPNKGDVIAIRRAGKDEEVASAPIGSAVANGFNIRIKGFHPDAIETMQIGDQVYRMSHSQLAKEVLSAEKSKTSLEGILREDGKKVLLQWTVSEGISKGITYQEEWSPDTSADSREEDKENETPRISEERAVLQLSKTGGTPFSVSRITIESAPAIPVSVLNLLRRESLAGISEKIVQSFKRGAPDSSQTDFSGVEDIVRQIDILDPVITRTPDKHFSSRGPSAHPVSAGDSSEENPSAGNLVSAYFYSWDGQVPSIACNADWYELPVWSFMEEQAFSGLRQLQEAEPGARIAVALPPGYIGVSRTIFTDLLKRLALQGVEAVVSGNPGNPLLCSALGMKSFQDSGSNVMNSATASLLKNFGSKSIVPSVELSMDPLIEMAKSAFAGSDCILELPAYGRLRLMYSEHCPVGYNRSGCKACTSGVAFAMKDRKGVSFPVICHREACTVDILNGDNLCAPAELIMMAKLCRIRARLYFTDETAEERKALVAGFRNVIQNPDQPQMEREIEKIRHIAVDIASVRNCGLTKGHYQRGMH